MPGKEAEAEAGEKSLAAHLDYPNGRPALRFTADGAGFAYYPSEDDEEPRVAVCVSKVNSYQNKYFFYDNSSQPYKTSMTTFQIPKTLLCSVNEHVIGHAQCRGKSKPGQISQFLMTADGGTLADSTGEILKEWLWDSARQNAGSPPREPIEVRLNKYLKFKFVDRRTISVTFKCDPINKVFDCGEKLRRLDTYIDNSTAVPMGDLRGKRELNMKTQSLMKRQDEFSKSMKYKQILLHPDSNRIQHAELAQVMSNLEEHFEPYERKIAEAEYTTKPYAEAGWKEAAHAQTLREVPRFDGDKTDLGATLGATFDADPSSFNPDKAGTASRPGSRFDTTANTFGAGDGAGATGIEEDFGEATLSGVAQEDGRWLTELAITRKLGKRHPVLERSRQLKDASGRYCIEVPVDNKEPAFSKLPVISSKRIDSFLSSEVASDQLVLMACLREDDPACRNATQLLEQVNGTLRDRYPEDPETGESKAPYVICKFDMAESRYMTKKYGVQTLPVFLMFYNAKLVYAGMLGGAKQRMPELDMRVNWLLLETDPRSQISTEKLLRKERFEWDLGCTVSNALSHVRRLAENGKRTTGATYGDAVTYHCCVLISHDVPKNDLKPLVQALNRRASKAGQANVTGYGGSRLCGNSLMAVMHPIGTVLPGAEMCLLCAAAVHEKKGGRASDILDKPELQDTKRSKPWVCPRCAIIQNPTTELLLNNTASVAMVKPLKVASLHTLSKLWHRLQIAKRAEAARRAAGGKAVQRGAEYESQDGAHMGLTHDDVLKKMAHWRGIGQRGQFLPADYKVGYNFATQDTQFKGVGLNDRAMTKKRSKK